MGSEMCIRDRDASNDESWGGDLEITKSFKKKYQHVKTRIGRCIKGWILENNKKPFLKSLKELMKSIWNY